jgi:hypothetical protein
MGTLMPTNTAARLRKKNGRLEVGPAPRPAPTTQLKPQVREGWRGLGSALAGVAA